MTIRRRPRARRPARRRTGACRSARPVRPPPHGLSRGKRALSASRTRAPARARCSAVAEPAGRRRRRGRRTAPPRDRRACPGTRLQLPAPQGFPSGQRGRAVNPLAQPSEVRILLPASSADRNPRARIPVRAAIPEGSSLAASASHRLPRTSRALGSRGRHSQRRRQHELAEVRLGQSDLRHVLGNPARGSGVRILALPPRCPRR